VKTHIAREGWTRGKLVAKKIKKKRKKIREKTKGEGREGQIIE
jgi:hypothetical protein